ncbi:MAG: TylF/MycF/NovP-related O-methyltransferase [Rhodospirillaceae bacterium]
MTADRKFRSKCQLALELLQSNKISKATEAFEKLVVSFSSRAEAWNNLGYAYLLQNRYDEAVTALKSGLDRDPNHINSKINLSISYLHLHRYEDAAKISAGLLKKTSGSDRAAVTDNIRYALGKMLDSPYLEKTVLELVQNSKNNGDMLSLMCDVLYNSSQYIHCIQPLTALLNNRPSDTFAREALAYLMFEAGDAQQSEQEFKTLFNFLGTITEGERLFHQIYNEGLMATQTKPSAKRRQRFINLACQLDDTKDLGGSIAECGTFRGLSSYVICKTIQTCNPSYLGEDFYGFDSFEGLSEPTAHDLQSSKKNPDAQAGKFSASLETVQDNLSSFPNATFFKGWIPDRFVEVSDKEFRFVHIDVDLYQPSKDAIEFFYPRLVSGGKIICDDYNWPGQVKAIEEYCVPQNISIERTETNQAIIVKT